MTLVIRERLDVYKVLPNSNDVKQQERQRTEPVSDDMTAIQLFYTSFTTRVPRNPPVKSLRSRRISDQMTRSAAALAKLSEGQPDCCTTLHTSKASRCGSGGHGVAVCALVMQGGEAALSPPWTILPKQPWAGSDCTTAKNPLPDFAAVTQKLHTVRRRCNLSARRR